MEIDIKAHLPHVELFSTVKARSERYEAAMREAVAMLPERPLLAKDVLVKALEQQA